MLSLFGPRQIDLGKPVADHPLNYGLVSWWLPLANNSGSSTLFAFAAIGRNDGVLTNGPVWTTGPLWPPGPTVSFPALTYDRSGAGQYALCKSGPILGGLPDWSVVALARSTLSASGGGYAIYCERGSSGNDILKLNGMDSGTGGNTTAGAVYRNDAGTIVNFAGPSGVTLNDGAWHFVAMTKRGTAVACYVDEAAPTTATFGSASDAFTDTVSSRIAGEPAGAQFGWGGDIGSVQLFNTALSTDLLMALLAQHVKQLPDLLRRSTPTVYSFWRPSVVVAAAPWHDLTSAPQPNRPTQMIPY